MTTDEQAAAASLRNLFFAAEQAHAEACKEGAALEQLTSAESSLLQLQCLLSVTAGQAPAGRHQADELLQQCISRLQGLSVQKRRSNARQERVRELLKEAGCPDGFRFTNPDDFDLASKLRQSEPHKSLLAGPLPSRRVQLKQAAAPPAPSRDDPGVLTEQPNNQQALPRRSGFHVPVAKPSAATGPAPAGGEGGRRHAQQQAPEAPCHAQDSQWAAKLPRRAHDAHVPGHDWRQRHGKEDDVIELGSSDDGGGGDGASDQPSRASGFQTAKSKLITDMRLKGQQYNPGQYGGGSAAGPGGGAPRQGLARPAGGTMRPAGLRKTGGGGAAAGMNGAGGKFVPPYVRKAIEAQGGGGSEEAEGPLSQRTLEILGLAPGEPLPEALAKLDPVLVENVCSEVMESGGKLDWSDIAGQQTAKDLIQEVVVWPIKNPTLFTGARAPPKGILLFGPPGTGKTMLGKAIATNISAVFFSISASSLVSKWIGEGERLVRALFAVAAHVAPSVIFIDEVDSLLSARKSDGEHESMRRLKTEILVQMEGIDPARAARRVLLIGATNRPEELDEAARRRMPKQLYIPLPDADARRDLVLRELGPGSSVRAQLGEADLDKVVARTQGYSGSDMKFLIQEACQGPVRDALKANGNVEGVTADALRPVMLRDFQMAARTQKASVEPSEIERYEQYNSKHGAKLMGSVQEEEEEDW